MSSEDLLVDTAEVAVEDAAETAENAEIEAADAEQESGAAETKEAVEEQEIVRTRTACCCLCILRLRIARAVRVWRDFRLCVADALWLWAACVAAGFLEAAAAHQQTGQEPADQGGRAAAEGDLRAAGRAAGRAEGAHRAQHLELWKQGNKHKRTQTKQINTHQMLRVASRTWLD